MSARAFRFARSLALVVGLARSARSQATALIDPTDPVYRDVQRLVGAGLVDRTITGQQPYSRFQLAEIVRQAERRLGEVTTSTDGPDVARPTIDRAEAQFLRLLVAEMRDRFSIEWAASGDDHPALRPLRQPIRSLTADFTEARSPTRDVPRNNGLGSINAQLNPLLANRQGRPLVDGSNLLVASSHTFESRHLAIELDPELQLLRTHDSASIRAVLQQAQLRLLYGNVAFELGREYTRWGQGMDVGLLSSNNAPPLNLLRLSNEQPVDLPWILRYLGASKFSIFYAKLGADQNFPYPYFVGYKASFAPSAKWEFGGVVYSKSGGHGAPRGTFSGRIMDLLPFLDASDYANKVGLPGKFEFSDRYAGVDSRLRFPALRGVEIYAEILLNDFDVRRLKSVFWEDAGHVFGLAAPRVSNDGRIAAWMEYHHTGSRYYEHFQFVSGQTVRRELLGDPLGPDASGLYANIDWYQTVARRFSIQLATERRSNDQYAYWTIPLPAFGWDRVEVRPKEVRQRVLVNWTDLPSRGSVGAFAQAGYERAVNYNFSSGQDRDNFLARVGLQYLFH